MCVIFTLAPGQMIDYDALKNAVYNNWHSYGVITMKEDGPEVAKVCPENEVDPDEVFDFLNDRKGYLRHVHLRHNTAGATNAENTHPFLVFDDKETGRKVWFMHNGTFYNYKSKKQGTVAHSWVDDPDGKSDTVNFCDRVLRPYLSGLVTERGRGSIQAYLFQKLVREFWEGQNRGLLISNQEDAVYLDVWKKIKLADGSEMPASNDEYFLYVKRGPEFIRREEKRKAEEAAAKTMKTAVTTVTTQGVNGIVRLADFRIPTHPFFQLSTSPCKIINDLDLYSREGAVSVGYLTDDELSELYDDRAAMLAVSSWVFGDYTTAVDELEKMTQKKNTATKIIADLKEEIKELREALLKEAA